MDKVEISVKSGDGGNGIVSFRHEKFVPFGGPDGGDGGDGGGVYLRVDRSAENLAPYRHKRRFKAERGKDGGGAKKHGKNGENLVLGVPPGTMVHVRAEDQEYFLADLNKEGQEVMVVKGGRGGLGNVHFATPSNQAPQKATGGEKGKEVNLLLNLKLIADVGIIGYPNAGKSTLVTAVSAARPRIADYPFTTIDPVLGEVQVGTKYFIIAEIPGLIEGAHAGKGLGHDFLQHAERTKVLVHLLDGSSETLRDDLLTLTRELELYDHDLAAKPRLVAVNKIDMPKVRGKSATIKDEFSSAGIEVYFISAASGEGVPELLEATLNMLVGVEGHDGHDEPPPKIFRPTPVDRSK